MLDPCSNRKPEGWRALHRGNRCCASEWKSRLGQSDWDKERRGDCLATSWVRPARTNSSDEVDSSRSFGSDRVVCWARRICSCRFDSTVDDRSFKERRKCSMLVLQFVWDVGRLSYWGHLSIKQENKHRHDFSWFNEPIMENIELKLFKDNVWTARSMKYSIERTRFRFCRCLTICVVTNNVKWFDHWMAISKADVRFLSAWQTLTDDRSSSTSSLDLFWLIEYWTNSSAQIDLIKSWKEQSFYWDCSTDVRPTSSMWSNCWASSSVDGVCLLVSIKLIFTRFFRFDDDSTCWRK